MIEHELRGVHKVFEIIKILILIRNNYLIRIHSVISTINVFIEIKTTKKNLF